jgi:hypothetical protein
MNHKPLSFDDITDLVEEAIAESMDVDWTCAHGARAVVRALRWHGVLRGTAAPDPATEAMLDDVFREALTRGTSAVRVVREEGFLE